MKLKKLVLTNFKKAKSLELDFDGKDAKIFGTNASGKTTVFDAMTWLLYDKPSTERKNFSPKLRNNIGQDTHFLENRVDGTFILDDGSLITFSKVLKENWVKKRGTDTETFSGNTTDYYVDGVPTTKTQYDCRVSAICSLERAQILTKPDYFPNTMTWQQRRKILLEVCGGITDFDVINSSDDLREITTYLMKPGSSGQFYSVEDFKKIALAKKKELDKRMEEVPARIDEATKALPDITGFDEEDIKASIASLQSEKERLLVEKANISQSEAEQINRRRLSEIQTEIAQGRAEFNAEKNRVLFADRELISQLISKRQALGYEIQDLRQRITRTTAELEAAKNNRELLSNHYRQQKEITWNGDTICHACGQALPSNNIEEAKAKFNLHKSNELERIRATIEAQCSKVIIADLEAAIEADNRSLKELADTIGWHDAQIEVLKIDMAPKERKRYEDTKEFETYAAQVSEIQAEINNGSVDTNESKRALQAKIEGVQALIDKEQHKLLLIQSTVNQKKRIDELKAEEKHINNEYDNTMKGLYLCEQFEKARSEMLSDSINRKFENVKFNLFQTQINGGIQEDCEVLVPGDDVLVPYVDANLAGKVNAGLEIINTLSKHWGVSLPVFIDGCESVVKPLKIDPQVICLIVSATDEKLRMEVD